MKLVVDTNVLFGFFWENSANKSLILNNEMELISPNKSLEEINKYKGEIIEKTKINEKKFNEIFDNLKDCIYFIKINDADYLKNAEEISPDKNDSEFLALCMKEGCPLWSNDLKLKKQNEVDVFTTEELIEFLDYFD